MITAIAATTVTTTSGQNITISISPLDARRIETPNSGCRSKTPNVKNRRCISASVNGDESLDCVCA